MSDSEECPHGGEHDPQEKRRSFLGVKIVCTRCGMENTRYGWVPPAADGMRRKVDGA